MIIAFLFPFTFFSFFWAIKQINMPMHLRQRDAFQKKETQKKYWPESVKIA